MNKKTVLVTGASRGIESTALYFMAKGVVSCFSKLLHFCF